MENTEQQLEVLTENEKQAIDLFKTYIENTVKFRSKGTASAGSRARKNASELTKLFKVIRKDIQETKLQNKANKQAQ